MLVLWSEVPSHSIKVVGLNPDPVWSLYFPPVSVRALFEFSGSLPHSKDMQVR